MKQTLCSFLSLLFLLCFISFARGQTTVGITGPNNVCSNSAIDYSATCFCSVPHHYEFSFVLGSQALEIDDSTRKVLWGAPGNGMVIVEVYDSSSSPVLLVRDTLLVTINPLPAPKILSTNRVSCAPMDEPNPQGNPPGQFTDSGCQKVCAFNTATYTAKGGTSSLYNWTVINGSPSSFTGNPLVVTWGSAGGGKVILEEVTSIGCKGTTEQCIDVVESPVAHFGAMPNLVARNVNICLNSELIFVDQSTSSPSSPIVSWRWEFGDGTYSNEKGDDYMPISHKYTTPGSFTVKLTVTNECGCSTTDSIIVGVSPVAGAEIKCPSVVCQGGTYDYSVAASCPGGTWQVIGGTINTMTSATINITWNSVPATGFGYVIYNPSGCPGVCPYPVAIKIPVVKTSGVIIDGPAYLCANKQYMYRMPQWPTTVYSWSTTPSSGVTLSPTDQPNEIVVTPTTATGSVTLKCNYTNTLLGCSGTATKVIQIPGAATIVGPAAACAGGEWTYSLTGPNQSSAVWKLVKPDNTVVNGAGPTFSGHFNIPGIYLLNVTGSFCPPDQFEIKVLNPPPTPESIEGPDRICRGVPTEYVAGTIDAANIFQWTLTNGTVNTAVGEKTEATLNPGSAGLFSLSVIRVTKEFPHCPSLSRTKVIELPIVVFDVLGTTDVCPSEPYTYGINYSEGEAYDWTVVPQDMGSVMEDPNNFLGQGFPNAQILWNKKTGPAKVICRVRKCNEYYYDTLDVIVRSLAITTTLPDTVCLKAEVFAQVSEATGGVQWWTGLQNVPGGANTVFRYENPIKAYKKYYVTATVFNPYGCNTPSEAKDSIVVKPAPSIMVTPSISMFCDSTAPPSGGINVPMTVTYDTAFVTPTGYMWDSSGVFVGTGTSYIAKDTGEYIVIGQGPYGCDDEAQALVFFTDCGYNPATPPPGCPFMDNDIVSLSTNNECIITNLAATHTNGSYKGSIWGVNPTDAASLNSSTDTTAEFTILKPGNMTFQYRSSYYNNNGDTINPICFKGTDTTIFVPYLPKVEVIAGCAAPGGLRTVTVRNVSLHAVPITSLTMYVDGVYYAPNANGEITANVSVPNTHAFYIGIAGGGYPLCEKTYDIKIDRLPVANFTFARSTTCEKDASVKFNNASVPNFTNLESLWDFDDGAQNNQDEPERVYNAPKPPLGLPYDVKLVVTDKYGCKDTVTKPVSIIAKKLGGDISITPPYPCDKSTATATYINIPGNLTPTVWRWKDIKDNSIFSIAAGSTPIYKSGAYYVHVEDQYGCYVNTAPDTIQFVKTPRAYIYGGNNQCVNVAFTLNGYVGQVPGIIYSWLRDGSIVSGATTDVLKENFTTTGTHNYRLIISVPNPGGGYCSDTSDNFVVQVRQANPVAAIFQVLNCANYTLRLKVTTPVDPFGTYNWNNGLFGDDVQVHYGGPFEVRYTDSFGCYSKYRFMAPKDLREYLWIFPTGCYSLCYTNPNIITGPIISLVQWRYLKNGGVYTSGSGHVNNMSPNAGGPGDYRLYLQNAWCNVTSGNMHVNFNCRPGGAGCEGCKMLDVTEINNIGEANLTLAPNPATNSTRVSYSYTGSDVPCYVEIYDAVGRVLYKRQLIELEGGFELGLDNYTPGLYKVMMRKQGYILKQATLSITR